MRSQQLFLIRSRVIEGRGQLSDQRGRLVHIRSLGLKGRLLVHPSSPLHYVALKPATSGAWRSQKSLEAVLVRGETIWECDLFEQVHRRVPERWLDELTAFLDLVNKEEASRIWLDTKFRFWRADWSGWSFHYRSEGNFDLYQGRSEVFRGSSHIYTGRCVAGVVQPTRGRG
jgi:hypothetical protein